LPSPGRRFATCWADLERGRPRCGAAGRLHSRLEGPPSPRRPSQCDMQLHAPAGLDSHFPNAGSAAWRAPMQRPAGRLRLPKAWRAAGWAARLPVARKVAATNCLPLVPWRTRLCGAATVMAETSAALGACFSLPLRRGDLRRGRCSAERYQLGLMKLHTERSRRGPSEWWGSLPAVPLFERRTPAVVAAGSAGSDDAARHRRSDACAHACLRVCFVGLCRPWCARGMCTGSQTLQANV